MWTNRVGAKFRNGINCFRLPVRMVPVKMPVHHKDPFVKSHAFHHGHTLRLFGKSKGG